MSGRESGGTGRKIGTTSKITDPLRVPRSGPCHPAVLGYVQRLEPGIAANDGGALVGLLPQLVFGVASRV